MRSSWGLLLCAMLVGSAEEQPSSKNAAVAPRIALDQRLQPQASSREEVFYCGGETDVATVERYFSDLRRALADSVPRTEFNAFVDDAFGIRNARGRTLYFNLRDVGSVTPGRISIQEWREISRRGARSLQSAGWRGCFMDHGKVWFEGSKENGFRLKLIARDMPWVEPEEGNALP